MSESSLNIHTHLEPHELEQQANQDESFVVTHPWIRHYEPGVPAHLEIPDQPLTWLLAHTASLYPDRTALIYSGTRLSYAQLAHHAHRFATTLQHLGMIKGDRVALALPNIPQYPIAFYGALLAGAVVVPTNPLYTEREMQHQLADAGARVLVMLDTDHLSWYADDVPGSHERGGQASRGPEIHQVLHQWSGTAARTGAGRV